MVLGEKEAWPCSREESSVREGEPARSGLIRRVVAVVSEGAAAPEDGLLGDELSSSEGDAADEGQQAPEC